MIYKCKNCGGNTVYNPEKKKMVCPNCTSEDSEEQVESVEARKCVMCGADVEYGDFGSAVRCEYCGAWQILRERVEGEYEPNLILPFSVSREKAVEILRSEFKARLFTPSDFLSEASLEHMQGSYVPFWMFDYLGKYKYEGTGTKIRTWRSGDTEYTETSKYSIRRNLEMDFEKIPSDASLSMPDGTMDLMEPYKYEELTGFDPKYLSGFLGEVYNDTADKFEPRAKKKARDAAEDTMAKSISGYTSVTPLNRDLTLTETDKKYALMPVWIYTYRFRGKEYPFYVNGQTGKVIGKTPVSPQRILGISASFFAAVGITLELLVMIFLEVMS